jgi:hypothetical protein
MRIRHEHGARLTATISTLVDHFHAHTMQLMLASVAKSVTALSPGLTLSCT